MESDWQRKRCARTKNDGLRNQCGKKFGHRRSKKKMQEKWNGKKKSMWFINKHTICCVLCLMFTKSTIDNLQSHFAYFHIINISILRWNHIVKELGLLCYPESHLKVSFWSFSSTFFRVSDLVYSLPSSQPSQTSSAKVSTPKEQLCLDAFFGDPLDRRRPETCNIKKL